MPQEEQVTTVPDGSSFLDPDNVVAQLEIKMGSRIADLGCGNGYMTIPFARAIGANGKVFAVDIRRPILQQLNDRVREIGLYNVETVWADLEIIGSTRIPKDSIDLAIASNVLFQIENLAAVFSEANRVVEPGGHLIVIDWRKEGKGIGPKSEHRVAREEVIEKLSEHWVEEDDLEIGEYHYGMIFMKKSSKEK